MATNKPKQMIAYDRFGIVSGRYIPHDNCVSDEMLEKIRENPIQDLINCDYCSTELLWIEKEIIEEISHGDYRLWYCRNCRFWQALIYSDPWGYGRPPAADLWVYVSKLREFNMNLPDGCSEELALYIRRHPDVLHSFRPTRFEKFVADVFRANYTNAEVIHVGKPHDGGIDVLLIDTGKEDWLIQVKHHKSQNHSEGVGTIRDMLGAMHLEEARIGIIVSAVKKFSQPAKEAAIKAGKVRNPMTIHLVDKGIFSRMLDPVLPDRPWLIPISQLDEGLANHLAERIPSDNQLDLFETQPFN